MGGRQPARGHFLPQQPLRQPGSPPRRAKALSSITLQILLEGCLSRRALPCLAEGARGGHLVAAAAAFGDEARPRGSAPSARGRGGGAGSLPSPSRDVPGAMPWQHWGPASILPCRGRPPLFHSPSRAHILHPTSCTRVPQAAYIPPLPHRAAAPGALPAALTQTLTRSAHEHSDIRVVSSATHCHRVPTLVLSHPFTHSPGAAPAPPPPLGRHSPPPSPSLRG